MRDAVMSLDPQGIVAAVNSAFEAIFDVTASELVGRSFAETMIEHPELEAFNDTVFDAVTDPSNTATHDIVVKRGGERRYLSVRTNLLRMPDTSARHGLIAANCVLSVSCGLGLHARPIHLRAELPLRLDV